MFGFKLLGKDGVSVLDVGPTNFAANVQHRPVDYGTGGAYRASVRTSIMSAALAINAVVFSARWGDAVKVALIQRLVVRVLPLTPFTAGTLTDHTSMAAYIGRSFSGSHTGGTALTLTGNNQKLRASMASSAFTDMRIATTAALGGGTITLDAQPFASSLRKGNRVNPAAATEETIQPSDNVLTYAPDVLAGEHPVLLAQNEGIVVTNVTAWPAAGTAIIAVEIGWSELTDSTRY
jgi:hypothetical protein